MKTLILKTLLIFFISINIAYSKDLDHLESLNFYENGELIIDVRNKDEWKESGVIPNAKLIQMLAPDSNIRNGYLEDLSGNTNLGIFIGDYKVTFNTITNKPKKTGSFKNMVLGQKDKQKAF